MIPPVKNFRAGLNSAGDETDLSPAISITSSCGSGGSGSSVFAAGGGPEKKSRLSVGSNSEGGRYITSPTSNTGTYANVLRNFRLQRKTIGSMFTFSCSNFRIQLQ